LARSIGGAAARRQTLGAIDGAGVAAYGEGDVAADTETTERSAHDAIVGPDDRVPPPPTSSNEVNGTGARSPHRSPDPVDMPALRQVAQRAEAWNFYSLITWP
jgi:hypothetical protein